MKPLMMFYPSKAKRSIVLESWFDHYNASFFNSALPKMRVYWYKFRKHNRHGATTFVKGTNQVCVILVNRNLEKSGCYALQTVLHEMIHVFKPKALHGPEFRKEKLRLLKAGAYNDIV